MYRTTYQNRLFTIYYSAGLEPLKNWGVHCRDGYMKRIYDAETGSLIMEMRTLSLSLHYITCPRNPKQTLGIRLPILNLLLRNTNKYFSFEVKITDDSKMHRRFRCANFLKCSSIHLFETTIPLALCGSDWILIYFNLAEFTRRCYNTAYVETDRVQINGNIQLRRIFFTETVIEYDKLPKDYQMILVDKKKNDRNRIAPKARPSTPTTKPDYKGKYPTRRGSERTSIENISGSASPELKKSLTRSVPTEKSFDVRAVEVSDLNETERSAEPHSEAATTAEVNVADEQSL